ncbi:hypothetical protein [Marilutibacter chinensis]|uniref:Uncharacterized protein n=1 Tax=Marilutibacter chinensis TaxID=2912247 RepID=A0ABS9HVM7_9GAMM|nr:hypothetical protein [Lysobacter chinensis]MCF7222936.1 hypothetical protein [Lysobacter chinensis]
MNDETAKPPPSDQPEWGAPYDWEWFKVHHLAALERHAQALQDVYGAHPQGEPFEAGHLHALLAPLDALATLRDWLPDSEGGAGTMDKLLSARRLLHDTLNGQAELPVSYWRVQEICFNAMSLVDYMQAMCED